MSHTKVIIKTDNEQAIVSLKTRVARLLREFEGFQNVQTESPGALFAIQCRSRNRSPTGERALQDAQALS